MLDLAPDFCRFLFLVSKISQLWYIILCYICSSSTTACKHRNKSKSVLYNYVYVWGRFCALWILDFCSCLGHLSWCFFDLGFVHFSPDQPDFFVNYEIWQAIMAVTCFLPGVTDNLEILSPESTVSSSVLSKDVSRRLFCNILFLDLNEAVPETERLDSKALKTRAQLSVKNRRQRPSRTRLYDSVSSTDGEDSLERKVSALDRFLTYSAGLYPVPAAYGRQWFSCNQILWSSYFFVC